MSLSVWLLCIVIYYYCLVLSIVLWLIIIIIDNYSTVYYTIIIYPFFILCQNMKYDHPKSLNKNKKHQTSQQFTKKTPTNHPKIYAIDLTAIPKRSKPPPPRLGVPRGAIDGQHPVLRQDRQLWVLQIPGRHRAFGLETWKALVTWSIDI